MKDLRLLILIALLCPIFGWAQTAEDKATILVEEPEFIFGSMALGEIMEKAAVLPKKPSSGKYPVFDLSFYVDEEGKVSDIQANEKVDSIYIKEGIRIISATNGFWKSGREDGAAVDMIKYVTIDFNELEARRLEYPVKDMTGTDCPITFAYLNVGNECLRRGYNGLAAQYYGLASEEDETCSQAKFFLGLAYFNTGESKEACMHWRQAKLLGSEDVGIYIRSYCNSNSQPQNYLEEGEHELGMQQKK